MRFPNRSSMAQRSRGIASALIGGLLGSQSCDTEDEETQQLVQSPEEEDEEAVMTLADKEGIDDAWTTLDDKKEADDQEWGTIQTKSEDNDEEWGTWQTTQKEEEETETWVALDDTKDSTSSPTTGSEDKRPLTQQVSQNVATNRKREQSGEKSKISTSAVEATYSFFYHQDISKVVKLKGDLSKGDNYGDIDLAYYLALMDQHGPLNEDDEYEANSDLEADSDESVPDYHFEMDEWVAAVERTASSHETSESEVSAIPSLDGADTDGSSSSDTPKKKKRKKRTGTSGNLGSQKKVKVTWEIDSDQPVAVPLRNGPGDMSDYNIERLFTSPDYAEYVTEKNARIENPQAGDIYIYRSVEKDALADVARMDGYRWRVKGFRNPRKNSKYYYSEVYAMTAVSEVYHTQFVKRYYRDDDTDQLLVQYSGDPRYGLSNPVVLKDVPKDRWYPEPLVVHPTDATGNIKDKAKRYEDYYKAIPADRKIKPVMSERPAVIPPLKEKSPSGDDDSDSVPFALTQAEKERTIRRPRPRERRPGEVTPEDTADEDEEAVDDPIGSQGSTSQSRVAGKFTYKPATSGKQLESWERLDLKKIWQLKKEADRMQAQCEAENREPFYQSILTTYIDNPQPYEVYFRDIKKIEGHPRNTNFDFEKKESQDSYLWRRKYNHFLRQEWCDIFKATYHYYDQESGKENPNWSKNFYIFPKDDKMIIVYKGDNSVAVRMPHRSARSEAAPDHYARFPEVKAQILEVMGKNPGLTPDEVYKMMTGKDRAGEGIQGVLNVPRNTRSVKNLRDQIYKQATDEYDIVVNLLLAESIAGGKILRRSEILHAENRFIVLCEDAAISEFKELCKNYKGNDPLMFHMDTSFNAGGKKSGFVITHLLVAHPYVTRERSDEESGVNFPLASIVHQRRTMPTINQLLMAANEAFKFDTVKQETVFVSDQEFGETTILWKKAKKVFCWNHLRQDVERKAMKNHHVRQQVAEKISNQVFQLLRCRDELTYRGTKNDFMTDPTKGEELWKNDQFQAYFNRYVEPVILNYSGRWKLEEYGIPNPERGITNNRAESLNASFNRLKIANIKGGFPETLLCYSDLVKSTVKEIRKSHFKQGDMKLNTEHQHLTLPESMLPAINYKTYGEMLKELRKTPNFKRMTDPAAPTPVKATENPAIQVFLDNLKREEDYYEDPENGDSFRVDPITLTATFAKYGFTLKNAHATDTYVTRFHPAQCSCPNGPACAHVFVLRKRANMEVSMDEKVLAVKMLLQEKQQRARGRPGKDYGTKQPRRDSYLDPTMMTPKSLAARRALFANTPPFFASPTRGRSRTPSPRTLIRTESAQSRSRTPSPSTPTRTSSPQSRSRTPSPAIGGRTPSRGTRGRPGGRARLTSVSSRSPSPAPRSVRSTLQTISDSSRSPSPPAHSVRSTLPSIADISPTREPQSLSTTTHAPSSPVTYSHVPLSPGKRTLPGNDEDEDDDDFFAASPKKTKKDDGHVPSTLPKVHLRSPSPLATTSFPPQRLTPRKPATTTQDPKETHPPSTLDLPAAPTSDDPKETQTTAIYSQPDEQKTQNPSDDDSDRAPPVKKKVSFSAFVKTLGEKLGRPARTVRLDKDTIAPTKVVSTKTAPTKTAPSQKATPKTAPPRPHHRQPILERVPEADRLPLYHKAHDSAVLTADGNINLKTALLNTAELKKIQIDPQESRWVEVDGKKMALIKSLGRGRAVIFYDKDYSTRGQDLAYVAGHITQEDAYVTSNGDLVFRVSSRECDKDLEKKATAGMASQTLQLGNKHKEYPLICRCTTPLISNDHAERLKIQLEGPCKCGDFAHPDCLPPSERNKLLNGGRYECTPCLVKELTEGVRWSAPQEKDGEQMINTCPIDNFLTAVIIFECEQNENLKLSFPRHDEEHIHLKESLDLIKRKQYNLAHTKYYKECKKMNDDFEARTQTREEMKAMTEHNKKVKEAKKKNKAIRARNAKIKEYNEKHPKDQKPYEDEEPEEREMSVKLPIDDLRKKNDLWGEVFTHVHDKHRQGFEVTRQHSCSNPECSNSYDRVDYNTAINLGFYLNYDNNLNGVEDLQKMTMAFEQACRECNDGVTTQKDYTAAKDHWALSFDATSVTMEKREKVKIDILKGKLPDTITIKNTKSPRGHNVYGLASITLREGGHFVSAHYIPSRGEFVFYDGMQDTRIRKFHPSDLMDESRELISVDYFRLE